MTQSRTQQARNSGWVLGSALLHLTHKLGVYTVKNSGF
jgi:hypothetical protein